MILSSSGCRSGMKCLPARFKPVYQPIHPRCTPQLWAVKLERVVPIAPTAIAPPLKAKKIDHVDRYGAALSEATMVVAIACREARNVRARSCSPAASSTILRSSRQGRASRGELLWRERTGAVAIGDTEHHRAAVARRISRGCATRVFLAGPTVFAGNRLAAVSVCAHAAHLAMS